MRKVLQAIVASAILLGTTGSALAVDIGGLNVPESAFGVGQIYENVVTGVGQTLTGYGKVDSINSFAIGSLCTDCELTYQFGGYVVSSISATEVRFSGGWVKFYLGFGADNDFNTADATTGSAGDVTEATNGTLFLTLKGHAIDAAGNTFVGTGVNINSSSPVGFGSGLLDVDTSAGGLANANFDTNQVPALFGGGNADFMLGSSFSGFNPAYPSECTTGQGPACVRGAAFMNAAVVPTEPETVPEPASCLLMLTGLASLAVRRRKR